MTKSWSSFEGQQLLQENWRNFLSEEAEPNASEKFFSDPELADQLDNEAPSSYPDLGRGLTSDMEGSNSLKLVLRQRASFLKTPQRQALISAMSSIAGDEGIMLELSLKGLNSEQDRIIDSAGTAELLNIIAGFGLSPRQNDALIKALNYWGRTNSIKFTAPPAPAPSVVDDIDDLPPADVEEDEPEEPSEAPPEAEIPQNPDPSLDTIPITREPPRSKEPVIKQVRGSGPAEPDPEPEEETRAWAGGALGWVSATPENALQAAIQMFAEPRSHSYRDATRTLKALEKLREMGAGLMFKDAETEDITARPQWIPLTDRNAEPGDMGLPPYYSSIVMPRSLKSVWQRFKDALNPRNTGDVADTSFDGSFSSDIDPQAIENLEDVIGQMRTNLQSMRKPADAEALQETYDRWQTIAGINKRVL